MTWLSPGPRNREVINLCQAVPSYPPAPELQEEIARLARVADTGFYSDILGTPELRSELARHMSSDYSAQIDPSQVAITAGCNQAFCIALMALAGPGDNVVMPSPWYFSYDMWIRILRADVRSIATVTHDSPLPRVADAASAIDDRTVAIVLCSPNNPTGATYPQELLTEFYHLAKSHGIALIVDETYKDFRRIAAPAHGLFRESGWEETFIQLYSFSKVFAMTGYRAGSLTAGQKFIAEVEKVMDCVAICAPRISQDAALFGLRNLASWAAGKSEQMEERVVALRDAFALPGLRYSIASAGAFFAYIRHPFDGRPAKEVAQMLARECDLLCLPGSMFGPGQDSYLRLAFANVDADIMPKVAARLAESQSVRF
jgi:aspartate/methionine/tyrosine aminotransferase